MKNLCRYLLALNIVLLAWSCAPSGINDSLITTGTSVAVSTYLGTIHDSARCHAIANLAGGIAGTLRTFTGDPPPTPAQLSQAIVAQIPENLRQQYPEVVAFVVPLVVQGYQYAVQKYGNNDQKTVYQILNDVASGVETGTGAGCVK